MSMTPEEKDHELYDNAEMTNENLYNSTTASPDSGVHPNITDPVEHARQQEEWRQELIKVDDEIQTLRQVLSAKVRRSQELKQKLGITPLQEWQHDIQSGLKTVTESDVYQKTSHGLKVAGEKTTEALSSIGTSVSKKMVDLRSTTAFKSFEEKMESAYTQVKGGSRRTSWSRFQTKVTGTGEQGGDDTHLLTPEVTVKSQSAPTTPSTDEKMELK
ncbi:PREDICTED: tumor protein D52-like isoform X3 [Priapulus caudatus]|uniref:Tumor protein D52-like isoform X3 n=1 Tax=Priapulus caudatus TaxID=37621 RepID=A0ABM1EV67_PRICU|nr:PREDICTED: tumor protein D52-like isoform X3 [Priapulus caudatus]